MANRIKLKRGTTTTPVLETGEIGINLNTKTLSVGNSNVNINFKDEGYFNNELSKKQNSIDSTLTTSNKTIVGGINELKDETTLIKTKLPTVTEFTPVLGTGLAVFDDTVSNKMVVDEHGIVTYNFCVTGGKSNNNIPHGATLCYIPDGVPLNKISYGTCVLEKTDGSKRMALTVAIPSSKKIDLNFIGETTAVSSARGTITWYEPTP